MFNFKCWPYLGMICHHLFTTPKSSPDCHVDMELDPTKNDDLHHYIWKILMKRIEVELARWV